MVKPTIISVFAGCGGSSLGYKLAGFKELLAIDFDKNATETFKLNFPNVPFWNKDIKKIKSKEILKFCKIKKKELDVLDGSPPCQGFSIAGKRNVIDERNNLFKEYHRLIIGLQPKVFVMENVSGMIKGKMKGKFIEIILKLKELNYNIKCKCLNAMYYDVPQSRQRLFFIGVRKDLNKEPIFPKPKKKLLTIKESLNNLNLPKGKILSKTQLFYWDKLDYGESASKYHPKGHWFGFIKINPDKQCPTIIKSAGNGLTHWEEQRMLSSEELKILSSFPKDFKLIGNESNKIDRIGNAVMPNQMKAIALCLKKNILGCV